MNRMLLEDTELPDPVERRAESRRPARGAGWLEPVDGSGIQAFRLVDISDSGFRARHSFTSLRAGEKVRFRHGQGSGTAVVVWNRVLGNQVESGFVVVTDSV